MAATKSWHNGLKICLAVSALFIIIVVTVMVALVFTIFKPKDPDISIHPVGLENMELLTATPNFTATLGIVITIVNRNYGAFRYRNSTAYISFHDTILVEIPLETRLAPARGKMNVTASADFKPAKLLNDPNFWLDIENGTLNLTSTATLPGKVIFKIIKFKGTIYIRCDIILNVTAMSADSKCISKIHI